MKKKVGRKKENLLVKLLRIMLIVVLSPFVLIFLITRYKKYKQNQKLNAEKIKIYDITQINSFSGEEFERYLKILFEQMGYKVSLTQKSKDYGVDLILEKHKKQTIVQAKCYSHTVGISAVQEIISARKHYNIFDAIVITNNTFSKEAQLLADENKVMLAGKTELVELVSQYPVYFERDKQKYVATTSEAVQEIETKYQAWI